MFFGKKGPSLVMMIKDYGFFSIILLIFFFLGTNEDQKILEIQGNAGFKKKSQEKKSSNLQERERALQLV